MTRWLQAAKGWHGAATTLPEAPPAAQQGVLSVMSVLSEGGKSGAETFAPSGPAPSRREVSDDPAADTFPHGMGIIGDPATWSGRVVSLADWRKLNEWERHGPNGRWFYGDTRQWEKPRGAT